MPKQSAGLLLYRQSSGDLEVLLVHPGGPFWRNQDNGVWTIPKGEVMPGESLLEAACREFQEETAHPPRPPFIELGEIRQKSGKIVTAWAFEDDLDLAAIRSNSFEMEWPPRSGRKQSFPEIDKAAFFKLAEAKEKINPAQVALLEQLAAIVRSQ